MEFSISIIGSFRKHNDQIQALCRKFRDCGVDVLSPQGDDIIQQGVDFVRFYSDNAASTDAAVQSLALHRILRSDVVYVFLPEGYIGKTTCYEVGRVLQAGVPVYFSQQPNDLPIHVPSSFVLSPEILLACVVSSSWTPQWLYTENDEEVCLLERDLRAGVLRDD